MFLSVPHFCFFSFSSLVLFSYFSFLSNHISALITASAPFPSSSSSSSCSWRVRCVSSSFILKMQVGPSISSPLVLCSFVILFDIVLIVLVFCLCPSSVRVVATFPGTVLFPLLFQFQLCYILCSDFTPHPTPPTSVSIWSLLSLAANVQFIATRFKAQSTVLNIIWTKE